MRLFIAINFDDEAKRRILTVQNKIKKEAGNGKFSPPENLHLTLVFLGETAEERLPEIQEAMIQAVSDEKFRPVINLVFSKAGFFKRGGKELWYLGTGKEKTDGETRLTSLQQRLAGELLKRNFFIDKRPFTAHITLGREIKSNPTSNSELTCNNGLWPFETENILIAVKRLSLMESSHVRSSGGKSVLVYTELFGYEIKKPD